MNQVRVVPVLLALLSIVQATITFERTFHEADGGQARVVVQTRDGGYILTYQGHGSGNQSVGCLVKTDSMGNLEWWGRYYSPLNRGAAPNGLCATLDGGYIFVGSMGGVGVSDGWAVKADSVGDTLWTYVYDGPGYDHFWSVAPTADSGCIISGKLSDSSHYGRALLKLSRDGRREWLKFYCLPDMSTGAGWVWQTADRGYFNVGTAWGYGSEIRDWYSVRTDSIGETLWTTIYRPDIPGYIGNGNVSACPTADGGCVLCGCDMHPPGYMSYLARLDSLGHGLWARWFFRDTVPGPYERMVRCAQETPDHGFIVTGLQGPGPDRVLVARLDSLGDTLWTRVYDGVNPSKTDIGFWVVNTRDGGFAISGLADDDLAYLIKTDSMGVVYVGVSERGPNSIAGDVLTAEPNPFRRVVNIRWSLTADGSRPTALTVYDAAGRAVRKLPSAFSGTWDGRDDGGHLLPAGTYFIEARAGSERQVVQVLMMR